MKTITRQELKTMIDEQNSFTLVETLPRKMFDEYHLPGAINIPVDDSFEAQAQQRIPDKDSTVVVYCKNTECDASSKAAGKLESLGYTDVHDYEAGKEDWKEADLQVV